MVVSFLYDGHFVLFILFTTSLLLLLFIGNKIHSDEKSNYMVNSQYFLIIIQLSQVSAA